MTATRINPTKAPWTVVTGWTLPSTCTGGDMHIAWNEGMGLFYIAGWVDFPNTTDTSFTLTFNMPQGFPQVADRYIHMGCPCGVSSTFGLIYGGIWLYGSTRKITLTVPFTNINPVSIPPAIMRL